MASSRPLNPQDRPAPLLPWVVVSLILFVAGLYFLRPDPVQPPQARATRGPSSSPTPERSEVDIGPEDGQARLAFVDSADSSFAKAANELSKRLLETTQGRVHIKSYPLGLIGDTTLDELQILNALQKNQLSLAIITCAPLTNISPRLEVMDLPFLFKDYAHADRVMLGDIGKSMLATFNGSGLVGLGSLEVGFRIFSSSLPLKNLEDFRGKRLRVMQSAASISMVRLMGAEAVPSPVNKIYQMAKEGYIDAADRTYPTYWDFKLYEVHRHIAETHHSYTTKFILTTEKFYNSLSVADRKALTDAVHQVELDQRKEQRAEDLRVKLECKKRGIKIHEFSTQERDHLAELCKSLYDEYTTLHGADILDGIRKSATAK